MGINKTWEIVYSNSAKINMGDYEQLAPFYSGKVIISKEDTAGDIDIAEEMEHMRAVVDLELAKNVENIKNAKKTKDIGSFKFYDRNGLKYVSVTSVLNPEPKTPEDEERLRPYGARGTALHRQFASLVAEGRLTAFTEEEKALCAGIGGFAGFEFWFKDDKRFDFRLSEMTVYNDKELYAGKYDANGFYGQAPALFDLKSGSLDKGGLEKAFMQLAAYDGCLEEPCEALVIIPVGPKSKKEPIVVEGKENIKRYFDMFLDKRRKFKERYGV